MTDDDLSDRDRSALQALARRAYEDLAAGDADAFRAAFADEFDWHVPGDNPASGTYRGAGEYFGLRLERMAPTDEWRLAIKRIFGNEAAASALLELHLTGRRKGRSVDMTSHHLLRFNADGKICEAIGFVEDQQTLDEFFRL